MRPRHYFAGRENHAIINEIYQHEILQQFEAAEKCFYLAADRYKSFIVWRELINELQNTQSRLESQIKIGIVYLLLAQLSIQQAEAALERKDLNDFSQQKEFVSKHFLRAIQFFRIVSDHKRADAANERFKEIIDNRLKVNIRILKR